MFVRGSWDEEINVIMLKYSYHIKEG